MININSCENCIHAKVCAIKDRYDAFCEAINGVCIYPNTKRQSHALKCEDIIIDVDCTYFKRERG